MAELAKSGAGADLVLTIDATLQHVAERELTAAVERHRARAGSVVMLDVRDSAILAMASWPTFDPGRFEEFSNAARRNRAVQDAYEPGSTFKVVTAAAGLESLVVHPDDRIDCEMGGLTVDGTFIRDHKPFGVLSFREVLENSSNVGVMKTALAMGRDPFRVKVDAFGLGSRTGVDLPGESAGQMHGPTYWKRRSFLAWASFGQGVSTTSLQMANVFAAIANGGMLHRPYVVKAARRDGSLIELEPPEDGIPLGSEVGRVMLPQTAQTILRMLEGVVENGTGKRAGISGYSIAGKTGTAEKTSAAGISATGRIASFVGIAPARDPRIVTLVMIDEPRGQTHGGTVAAPVYSAVVSEALLYLGISPGRQPFDESAGPSGDFAWFELPSDTSGYTTPSPPASPTSTPVSSRLGGGG